MKRYRLLKDLPTFNKGDTFRLTEHGHLMSEKAGVIAYAEPTLEKFNILDSDWFGEIPEGKRWRAGGDERYWCVQSDGEVVETCDIWAGIDDEHYELGNYFKTKEEAQKAAEWLKAFAVLRDDTKGFKPDWTDEDQEKWSVEYGHDGVQLITECYRFTQEGIIYFATAEDAEKSIETHEREWRVYYGVEE